MSINEINPGNGLETGVGSSTGLPGSISDINRDLLGQPLSKAPSSLGSIPTNPLLESDDGFDTGAFHDSSINAASTKARSGASSVYGDEFESGIPPIDFAARQIGKVLDFIDKTVEESTPGVRQFISKTAARLFEATHDGVDTARRNWNAPDNELREALTDRVQQGVGFLKKWAANLSENRDVRELMDNTITAGRNLAEKTGDVIQNAQVATESWLDRAYNETYGGNSPHIGQLSGSNRLDHAFVGVIDSGFNAQDHGTQVMKVIQQVGHQFPDWLADSVGSGTWSKSLVNFVDAAKASERSNAVINLSFDLTQINPDGSVSTRFELTAEEREALKYAQANEVLVVVSAGNQSGAMSALGQASQDFDNVIAVGATKGGQRAEYSSYSAGLDFVASGQGKGEVEGTSLAAARVTGSIARIWDANPQFDYRQVTQTLESTATDLQQSGWDHETGFGRLNTSAAIALAEDLASQPQSLSNSQLQNTIKRDQADQDLHNGIFERESSAWQELNGAIPSERPNRMLEGDGIETEPTPNVTTSSSELSSLDHLLKYEPGVPLQYDEQVKQWQQRMSDRGWNITADGLYGSQSDQIARQFQQEKGLAVDGIVGSDTWAATFDGNTATNSPPSGLSSLDHLLKYEPGMPLQYDEQVKQWQQRMSDRGWNITADGLYGSQSAQITRQFQQEKGLAVDGIVGSDTWAATFDGNTAIGSFIPALPNTPGIPGSSPGGSAQQMLDVARSFIGVREQGGDNRGAQVQEFQRVVDGVATEEAWCMGFAQYCIKAAEGATQSDSPVVQSEHCLTVWDKSPSELKRSNPEPGSLVIWQHGNSRKGHVGIVEAVNSNGTFTTIEGNTSDSSGINREGDGVYRKQRTMNGAGDMRIVGFLKVFPELSNSVAGVTSPSESSFNPGSALAAGSSTLPTGELLKYEAGTPLIQGESVKAWQEFLNEQGYSVDVDGVYGSESADATRRFQQSQGITDDGIVGQETWAATFDTTRVSQNYGSADAAEVWNAATALRLAARYGDDIIQSVASDTIDLVSSEVTDSSPQDDPSRIAERESFEAYPDVEQSTSWAIPLLRPADDPNTDRTTTAENGVEVGLASQGGYEVVYLQGQLLEQIKADPDMIAHEHVIIEKIQEDPRYGRESFHITDKELVGFGGQRWTSPEESWLAPNRLNPLLHLSTYPVLANELTWVLRNATVEYWAEVTPQGEINIEYRLNDRLDLSPTEGRSPEYNAVSTVSGFGYHDLAGGNRNLQTRAEWNTTVDANHSSPNLSESSSSGGAVDSPPRRSLGGRVPDPALAENYKSISSQNRRQFMEEQLSLIQNDPSHPLRRLLNADGTGWIGRDRGWTPSEKEIGLHAGHVVSRHGLQPGELETFALEDGYQNLSDSHGRAGEWGGTILERTVLDIGGVPIESRTALTYANEGYIDKAIVENAPVITGWRALRSIWK